MKPRLLIHLIFTILLAFPLVLSCGQKQAENKNSAAQTEAQTSGTVGNTPQTKSVDPASLGFTGAEEKLVDTLLAMWAQKGHLTSVDQAAKMLGIQVSDAQRLELFKKFSANPALSEKLSRYRPATFILTNQEKLIAQYVIVNEKLRTEFPALALVAADIKMAEADLKDRLKFLARIGLLYDLGQADASNKLGYSFGTSMGDFTFDMGLRYHVFYVDDKLPFNVGCAKEALFLVATEFANNRVRYETYDPHTLEPVAVVFDHGKVESLSPPTAKMVEGGSCGQNNLFVSQQNADAWTKTQPRLAQQQTAPVYDIDQRLAQLAEQEKKAGSGK